MLLESNGAQNNFVPEQEMLIYLLLFESSPHGRVITSLVSPSIIKVDFAQEGAQTSFVPNCAASHHFHNVLTPHGIVLVSFMSPSMINIDDAWRGMQYSLFL